MNFDYLQTQAEVTFQRIGKDDWAFKKVPAPGSREIGSGPENEAFNAHQADMASAGWTLVSLAAAPRAPGPASSAVSQGANTARYDLSWKRLKEGAVAAKFF